MLIRSLFTNIIQRLPLDRTICTTTIKCRSELRELRKGHIGKVDHLEGEKQPSISADGLPFEYIDDNLMDKVIDNVKFKDIPMIQILCSRNNTKMCIATQGGKVFVSKTAGTEGYKNCRKGTTVAAQAVANRIVTFARDHEINMARLVFNGLGPGRGAAYKVVELSGIKIVSLSDRTEAMEPWTRRPRKAKRL